MARTIEDMGKAIKQIRDYAATYKGKRSEFYGNLYAMLATPIPTDKKYNESVKKMYIAAIGTLTWEIQPPTAETYIKVIAKLNSVLEGKELEIVNIAIYSDEGVDDAYQIVGEAPMLAMPNPRIEQLQNTLPRKRTLTKKKQALVDKFRSEIPTAERPFMRTGQQRG